MLSVCGEHVQFFPIGKRTSRLPERSSDGLFLGVVDAHTSTLDQLLVSSELEVCDDDLWKSVQTQNRQTDWREHRDNQFPPTLIQLQSEP